jgi:hypothetical protein
VQACYQHVHLIADLGVACQRGHPSREDPARSPSTNAYAERFVLTAPSQVTHRILIFGERHLRSVLAGFARHYNGRRPIAAVSYMASSVRSHKSPVEASTPARPDHPVADLSRERIKLRPVRGGLVNQYERAA